MMWRDTERVKGDDGRAKRCACREATRHIPILICSSDPNEVKGRAGHLEMMPNMDVPAKPFDPEAWLAKVAYMMDGCGPA